MPSWSLQIEHIIFLLIFQIPFPEQDTAIFDLLEAVRVRDVGYRLGYCTILLSVFTGTVGPVSQLDFGRWFNNT